MAAVSPPRLVGTQVVADSSGARADTVRRGIEEAYADGYVGKIGGRHCWDLNLLIELSASTECQVCGEPGGPMRLCPEHARLFMHVWDRAERSQRSLTQFVALCRWVSTRWEHLSILDGIDPWDPRCATPGCEGEANIGRHGPLCSECAAELYRAVNLTARVV